MADTVVAPPSAAVAAPAQSDASDVRYEPVRLLGEGGMGQVEHARDRDLLRDVAVKLLRPELRHDAHLLEQFLWEARVTAYLDHPNIVPVHDLGTTAQGDLFFTMKLVRGETLEQVIERQRGEAGKKLTLAQRLRLFLQLCQAVSFAHARGVLHRDLKPANVMIGEFGEVLVTDWGLALPLPGADGEALARIAPAWLAGESAGTPVYMSPEQVRGDALDARSDIYTLGVILHELVALAPAFDAPSVPAVFAKILAGESASRAALPGPVAAVIGKAMALDPADRYPDATLLAADVETALDGRTPDAEHPPLMVKAARLYVSRDPGFANLRVVDIDSWVGAGFLLGIGVAALFAAHLHGLGWLGLPLGIVTAIPSTVRWYRARKEATRRAS